MMSRSERQTDAQMVGGPGVGDAARMNAVVVGRALDCLSGPRIVALAVPAERGDVALSAA